MAIMPRLELKLISKNPLQIILSRVRPTAINLVVVVAMILLIRVLCVGNPTGAREEIDSVRLSGLPSFEGSSMLVIHPHGVVFRSPRLSNPKKIAPPCKVCKGKGFYTCKLCKANSTIEWSPLHDPIFINPCVCPTCEGNRIQRCLNCLGKGYV
ncbi:uncharacterized protein [Aristolochia californica]|uniref:uncharacterized protein n=1 Tax=Aristolochia californica TaxID=171875 RepID=UPI0035E0C1F9